MSFEYFIDSAFVGEIDRPLYSVAAKQPGVASTGKWCCGRNRSGVAFDAINIDVVRPLDQPVAEVEIDAAAQNLDLSRVCFLHQT